MLKLMYITNNEKMARAADKCGIDRVMIDLEKIGKAQRQEGWNSLISDHFVEDVDKVKSVLTNTKLLVRVNPINPQSEDEINRVIENHADIIMLPYFKSADEVRKFVGFVGGRVKVCILIETKEAVENIDEILSVEGIDEVHIGLNDLSHSYNKKFLFEIMADGTVEYIVSKLKEYGIKDYGVGGIARVGYGVIPAEDIICEHYRIGSTCAILSRAFCSIDANDSEEHIINTFSRELAKIRRLEKTLNHFDSDMFEYNRQRFVNKVAMVTGTQGER